MCAMVSRNNFSLFYNIHAPFNLLPSPRLLLHDKNFSFL